MKNPARDWFFTLRGIVVLNWLAIKVVPKKDDFQRDPAALTSWFAKVEREVYGCWRDADDARGVMRHRCMQFLHGGLPGTRLFVALAVKHIRLITELFDPRWVVLRLVTVRGRWTKRQSRRVRGLSYNLLVNNRPLSEWTLTSFKRLMGNPHSSNLTLALVTLTRPWGGTHRDETQLWLRERFVLLLLLICQQPELKGASRILYLLLDHLFSQQILAPVRDWPCCLKHFKKRLKQIKRLQHQLQHKRGYSRTEALTLIQTYFNDLRPIPAWTVDLRDYLSDIDRQADLCLKRRCWQGDVLIDSHLLPPEPKAKMLLEALSRFLLDHPPKEPSQSQRHQRGAGL